MLPATLVTAAGMAMAFIPSLGMALSAAAPEEGGLASGIVNTNYQVGSALGLAAMTAVASAFGADQIGDAVALTDGFSAGLRRRGRHRCCGRRARRGDAAVHASGGTGGRRPGDDVGLRGLSVDPRLPGFSGSGTMRPGRERRAVDELGFRLLGPMEITVGGHPVALPGSAERALLVQLLLAPGRTIPASLLVDRLWAESSLPVDPMNALQVRVSKLRRSLAAVGAADLVHREGVGYRASVAPEAVDAVDFEARVRVRAQPCHRPRGGECGAAPQLRRRAGPVAGEPLSDFLTEPWATAEAARLSELRLTALTERAQVALALGRHHEVVADLEPLTVQDPTQESLVGLLMVALYRSGRQAAALEAFTRTREVLDEELGLEPSTSLRSLHERVLRQDPSLGTQPDPSPPLAAPRGGARADADGQDQGRQTNLPSTVRALIGRDEELSAITDLLGRARLVSLVGPGGAGKTTLAVAAAVRAAPSFPDGAFEVRLGAVRAAQQVPLALADALGVPLDGAGADPDVRRRVVALLARRRVLLVVDNCEHVIDAVAALVEEIVGECPGVTVLATSREALAIAEEVQLAVGPLAVPPAGTEAARVLDHPAAQLFAERARAVRGDSVTDAEDLLAVGRVARALDGIPLALELAAARVGALSPAEISERLEQRFALLTSGARTAEARQQTLRATVDWSYDLLTEREQRVFNRLSVFHGGCTLPAAEAVLSDDRTSPGEVLDVVARLVDRSMLVAEPGPTTRYRLLETVRHYARERLEAVGETETLSHRHAAYYRGLVEEAEPELRGHGQRAALRRLRAEQANLRAALDHLGGPGGDLDAALTTAGSLGLFWHLGRHLEGREVLARLLASGDGAPEARARALQAVSLVERPRACLAHPSPRCAETARESLAVFEQVGDAPRAALSRVLLAVEGVTGTRAEESAALLAEAEAEFAREGDAWGAAVIGFVRMETALKRGDQETGVPAGHATAAAFRAIDDPWGLSAALYHLGWGLRQLGRLEESARVLEEAIDVAASAGLHNTVQWALGDLGIAHLHRGDLPAAVDAFDRAVVASELIGDGAGAVLADLGHGLVAVSGGDWVAARGPARACPRGVPRDRHPGARGGRARRYGALRRGGRRPGRGPGSLRRGPPAPVARRGSPASSPPPWRAWGGWPPSRTTGRPRCAWCPRRPTCGWRPVGPPLRSSGSTVGTGASSPPCRADRPGLSATPGLRPLVSGPRVRQGGSGERTRERGSRRSSDVQRDRSPGVGRGGRGRGGAPARGLRHAARADVRADRDVRLRVDDLDEGLPGPRGRRPRRPPGRRGAVDLRQAAAGRPDLGRSRAPGLGGRGAPALAPRGLPLPVVAGLPGRRGGHDARRAALDPRVCGLRRGRGQGLRRAQPAGTRMVPAGGRRPVLRGAGGRGVDLGGLVPPERGLAHGRRLLIPS